MSDSKIINKIEKLLDKSSEIKFDGQKVIIHDKNQKKIEFYFTSYNQRFTELVICSPTTIESEKLDVNPGEIERLYSKVEWLKWKNIINYLSNYVWQNTNIYKPSCVEEAQNCIIHFLSSCDKIASPASTMGWQVNRSVPDRGLSWEDKANKVKFNFSESIGYKTITKGFFWKRSYEKLTKTVHLYVDMGDSSWRCHFDIHDNVGEAITKAYNNRKKSIVDRTLSEALI